MRPMRLVLLLSILAILAAPAWAVAAGEGAGGGDMGAGGMAGQEQQIEGSVSKVDQQQQTVSVQPTEPGQMAKTLHVDQSTQVMGPEGQQMSWNELKEGDRIRASFMKKDGKDQASSIEVMPEAGAGAGGMEGGGAMQQQQQGGGM